ncbi:MAG: NACHT domain-containing protein [Spirosomataceae bacterium]
MQPDYSSFHTIKEFFKQKNSDKHSELVDEYYNYVITSGTLIAIVTNPTEAIASLGAGVGFTGLKASNVFNWLRNNLGFSEKGKELSSIERYQKAYITNFLLAQLSIKESIEIHLYPYLENIAKTIKLSTEESKEIQKKSEDADKRLEQLCLSNNLIISTTNIQDYAATIYGYILQFFLNLQVKQKEKDKDRLTEENKKINSKIREEIATRYNAYLINLSVEFPEFANWVDISYKDSIEKLFRKTLKNLAENHLRDENKKFEEISIRRLEQVIKLQSNEFKKAFGLQKTVTEFENIVARFSEKLKIENNLIREGVEAHHQYILKETNEPLVESEDIMGIKYPTNAEVFVPQSFKYIRYKSSEISRRFILQEYWNDVQSGEDIGSFILRELFDPINSNLPIIILGHPGAGKSMLSKIIASRLIESNEFIPFLIKLREVTTNTTNVSSHVNEGIQNTFVGNDIDWLKWAKEFKNRIPVIILDGFDELLRASSTELNNYLNNIKDFQEKAKFAGISIRVILTSRLSVMKDVTIPDYSRVIRLDSFDNKRQELWINAWNGFQDKEGFATFKIPKNKSIEDLAKEPLLLFMLAVYDFESSELQKAAKDEEFNQSKLYEALFDKFSTRQLEKNERFNNCSQDDKELELEKFRLRLGLVATLMFLQDSTNKDAQNIKNELDAFGLSLPDSQTKNIFSGFFFIHQNQAKGASDSEKYNYEFLHKTFGEFLAADFLLRLAKKQINKIRDRDPLREDYILRFCFGFNWLHKHYNIQRFLFEHAEQVLLNINTEILAEKIKSELENVFSTENISFSSTKINLQDFKAKPVIEHLAIYSQNLIFLWVAVSTEKEIKFDIYPTNEVVIQSVSNQYYETEDRPENNKNKLLWKRLTKLWGLIENTHAIAKLGEWIKISEYQNHITLKRSVGNLSENNYSIASKISLNKFEQLISNFLNDLPDSKQKIFSILEERPEFEKIVFDVLDKNFLHYNTNEQLEILRAYREKEPRFVSNLLFTSYIDVPSFPYEFKKQFLHDLLFRYPSQLLQNNGTNQILNIIIKLLRSQNSISSYQFIFEIFDILDHFLDIAIIEQSDRSTVHNLIIEIGNVLEKIHYFRHQFRITNKLFTVLSNYGFPNKTSEIFDCLPFFLWLDLDDLEKNNFSYFIEILINSTSFERREYFQDTRGIENFMNSKVENWILFLFKFRGYLTFSHSDFLKHNLFDRIDRSSSIKLMKFETIIALYGLSLYFDINFPFKDMINSKFIEGLVMPYNNNKDDLLYEIEMYLFRR